MIGSLRKYTQTSLIKVILWTVLFVMGASSFLPLLRLTKKAGVSGNEVAKVGDYEISVNEFRRKYIPNADYIREIKKQYGPQAELLLTLSGIGTDAEKITLEELVQEKIVQSAADNIKPEISKEYMQQKLHDPLFVNKYLSNIIPAQAFDRGVLNVNVLANLLRHMNITDDEFEAMINDAIKMNLFAQLLEGTVYISQDMLKQEYIKEYAKRKFSLFTINMDEYLKKAKAQKVSDEDLKKFYDSHKEKYRIGEKRNAQLWTFEPSSYGITITDKDIENYYTKNKNSFMDKHENQIRRILIKVDKPEKTDEQRKRAQEIATELEKNPEAFEQIAKKESDGKEKGEIITIKKGEKEPLYDRAAFALSKANDISPVIKTTEGFEIIKLISKKAVQYKPLNEVKKEIKKKILQNKFDASFSQDAQRVLKQEKDLPDVFSKFVKKAKESTLSDIEKQGGMKENKLFGIAQKGDKAFYQEDGKGYIIELTSIINSMIPPFDAVKEGVTKDIYAEKAHDALVKDLHSVREKLQTENEGKATQGLKVAIEHTDWIDPQDTEALKKLEKKQISRDKILGLTKSKQSIEFADENKGYIVELTEIEGLDMEKFKSKQKDLELNLYQSELQNISQSFMNNLRAKTKVVVNNDLLRKATSRR